jgi:hypothetical protein
MTGRPRKLSRVDEDDDLETRVRTLETLNAELRARALAAERAAQLAMASSRQAWRQFAAAGLTRNMTQTEVV